MGGPRKQSEWSATTELLSTPSHMRSYIDQCKEWLLAIDDDQPPDLDTNLGWQCAPSAIVGQKNTNIGLRGTIPLENSFDCFACGTLTIMAEGTAIIANPFTRSSHMLVCKSCETHLRGDRQ